ncbi:MAG TPA: transposase zinc-binding domain-containing protein [Burkholderiales bacterium]|nr:transposase zinc-binding domain-containing protein [Burkholderiales bacterium]
MLAFSCKARYFCPSCHQKRVLAYGDWVEENVLAPVPHRQYVFTVPRMLRPIFSRKRGLLAELCHIVEHLLISAYSRAGVEGRPGLILFVQTFGDLLTFNRTSMCWRQMAFFAPTVRSSCYRRFP